MCVIYIYKKDKLLLLETQNASIALLAELTCAMSGVEGIVRDMILIYSSTKYFILLASSVVAEGLNFKVSFAKMPLK